MYDIEKSNEGMVFYPWRRYLARMLDTAIYSILWMAVLAFGFNVIILNRGTLGQFVDIIVGAVIMLFIEPVMLRFFGTTPGKAIFGFRLSAHHGGRLTYGEGFYRTWSVLGSGMGYAIPVYSIYCLWQCRKICLQKEPQSWDDEAFYTISDSKWYRGVFYTGAYVLLIALIVLIIAAQQLPPNRGDITVEEFAENYNYYAKYCDIDFGGWRLDKNGQWTDIRIDETTSHYELPPFSSIKPEFLFTQENGYVTAVSFTAGHDTENVWVESYNNQMLLTSLALVGAQREMGLFTKLPGYISEQIMENTFEDFSFTAAGITVRSDTEYSGYINTGSWFLVADENAEEHSFSLSFYVDKQ